jgi:cell division transport system permease protein
MPASVQYVTRETASNLWRNRLMTIAAVLTVAVSLSLVGAALLLRQGAAQASSKWERGIQVVVWMKADATAAEINAVGAQLHQLPVVFHPCTFRNHKQDLAEFKDIDPELYSEAGLGAAQIPTSWRCVPTAPSNVNVVKQRFLGQQGVLNVTAPEAAIHAEERAITIIQVVMVVIAAVLLISSIVLILNTIRMAIFARRREVSVMKLVGATNWFIRVPFMSEGLFEGILGSAFAAGLVYFLHWLIGDLAGPNNIWSYIALSGWDTFVIIAVVMLIGAAVGTAGSFVAIRRFLDV